MQQLFARRRTLPVILQTERAECGLACIAMISGYFGQKFDISTLRREHPVSSRGATLRNIQAIAEAIQLRARPLRLELHELAKLQLPAVLHWNMRHFVVLKRVTRHKIVVHDPAVGERTYPMKEVSRRFTGVAVEFEPAKDFKPREEASKLAFADLFAVSSSYYTTIGQVILLSLFLQVLMLAIPFYIQISLDEGLRRRDMDFALVIAIGLALVFAMRAALAYLRGQAILYLSGLVQFQIVGNVFGHLMRLPVEFFERRAVNDLSTRFGSTDVIGSAMTRDGMTVLMDGVFSVLTLVLLCVISPILTAIGIGGLLVYMLYRLFRAPEERASWQDANVASVMNQLQLNENIRLMPVIKMFGREGQRASMWQNNYAEVVNSRANTERFELTNEAVRTVVFGIDAVITGYVAFSQVQALELTAGQMFAYLMIKQQFTTTIASFVGKLMELRMLRFHLERLADITSTTAEFDEFDAPPLSKAVSGDIRLSDVGYGYPGHERAVLSHVSFEVKAGEILALTGPSGSGKSTLLKLISGLITPHTGTLTVDGRSIAEIGLQAYRRSIGCVLQSGRLIFAGSIQYNITMFDGEVREREYIAAAKLARIHDEIMELPMQYQTPLRDRGSNLSAGQVERILLARALFRRPKILLLDEALSNVNNSLERSILESLKELGTTIVMVTHSRTAMELADRVASLERSVKIVPVEQRQGMHPALPVIAAAGTID